MSEHSVSFNQSESDDYPRTMQDLVDYLAVNGHVDDRSDFDPLFVGPSAKRPSYYDQDKIWIHKPDPKEIEPTPIPTLPDVTQETFGKVLMATPSGIKRYYSDTGSIDNTFTTIPGWYSQVTPTGDGKFYCLTLDSKLKRLNSDGTTDTTFAPGPTVMSIGNDYEFLIINNNEISNIRFYQIRSDGKIFIFFGGPNPEVQTVPNIALLSKDGVLLKVFGGGLGRTNPQCANTAPVISGFHILSNNKVLLFGVFDYGDASYYAVVNGQITTFYDDHANYFYLNGALALDANLQVDRALTAALPDVPRIPLTIRYSPWMNLGDRVFWTRCLSVPGIAGVQALNLPNNKFLLWVGDKGLTTAGREDLIVQGVRKTQFYLYDLDGRSLPFEYEIEDPNNFKVNYWLVDSDGRVYIKGDNWDTPTGFGFKRFLKTGKIDTSFTSHFSDFIPDQFNESKQLIGLSPSFGNYWKRLNEDGTLDAGFSLPQDGILMLLNSPRIKSGSLAQGAVGASFSFQVEVEPLPATFSSSQPMPSGLTLNSQTGLISGTPTEAGITTLTIYIDNSVGRTNAGLNIQIFPGFSTENYSTPALRQFFNDGWYDYSQFDRGDIILVPSDNEVIFPWGESGKAYDLSPWGEPTPYAVPQLPSPPSGFKYKYFIGTPIFPALPPALTI